MTQNDRYRIEIPTWACMVIMIIALVLVFGVLATATYRVMMAPAPVRDTRLVMEADPEWIAEQIRGRK